MSAEKQEYLYKLELEHGKYYVGKTTDVKARYDEHLKGQGAAWTQAYRPYKLAEVRKCTSAADESLWTEELMKRYGIHNVRGAEYCSVKLPEHQVKSLEQKFQHADNTCYHCRQRGHYVKDCPYRESSSARHGKGEDGEEEEEETAVYSGDDSPL